MDWTDRIGRRLKPRDLHVFLSVADHGNMAKAADSLAISRPVVSKTIADLEQTLDVRLFDRHAHGVEPTLYGRALLKRAIVIFDELRQSVKEIEFLADPNAGELRLGCTEVMAAGFVSAVIDRLSRQYPKLVFQTELGNNFTLPHSLRERKCELVIARADASSSESDMSAEALFHEQLFVGVGPHNKWVRRRKVTLAELVHEPWILSPREVEVGAPVTELFRTAGLKAPKAQIWSDSLNLRTSLLASGRFLTMIPSSVLRFGPQKTMLKVLSLEAPPWRQPISIIALKNRTLSPLADLFIKCAREMARPLATVPSRAS